MIIDHKFMDKSVSQGKNKYRIAAVFCNKKPKGMNFMKKLLSAAFCLSLICTGLTACGDKDDNSSNASSRDSSAADSNISATDASIDSSTENYTDNTDNTVNNNNNNNLLLKISKYGFITHAKAQNFMLEFSFFNLKSLSPKSVCDISSLK